METNPQPVLKKISFDKAGYFILIFIPIVILAFWPAYFSLIFSDIITPSFYTHFHGIMMFIWISLLIAQPILIRKNKLKIHRLLGKISYLVGPLVLVSMVLIIHHLRRLITEPSSINFTNLNAWLICYTLAILYRHKTNIHARAMIGTAIALLDPILMRFMYYVVSPLFHLSFPLPSLIAIGIIFGLLITLIVLERKQKRGRWIFPFLLGFYIFAYSIIFFNLKIPYLDSFYRWFTGLPLTPDPKPKNNLVDYTGVYSLGELNMNIRDSSFYLIAEPHYIWVWKNNDEFFHSAIESAKFERNDNGDIITLKRYFGDKVSETWKKNPPE